MNDFNVHPSKYQHVASVLVRDKEMGESVSERLGHAAGNVFGEDVVYPQAVEICIYKGIKVSDKHAQLLHDNEDGWSSYGLGKDLDEDGFDKATEKFKQLEAQEGETCYFVETFYIFPSLFADEEGEQGTVDVGPVTHPEYFRTEAQIKDELRDTDTPWEHDYRGIAGGEGTQVFDTLDDAVKAAERTANSYRDRCHVPEAVDC